MRDPRLRVQSLPMAFSLARLHEAAVNKYKSVHSRLEKHKGLIAHSGMELARTGEAVGGGGVAAVVDYYMGDPNDPSGIPEAMVGPVPVVLSAALAAKAVAFGMGTHEASTHIHGFGNGLAAAGTYATTMRFLKAHASSSGG